MCVTLALKLLIRTNAHFLFVWTIIGSLIGNFIHSNSCSMYFNTCELLVVSICAPLLCIVLQWVTCLLHLNAQLPQTLFCVSGSFVLVQFMILGNIKHKFRITKPFSTLYLASSGKRCTI